MRQNHWDAARAGLMLLGIPYHVAWLYGPPLDWGDWLVWFAPADQRSPLLWSVVIAIHAFRMQVFFVIAGYFVALTSTRYSLATWFRRRLLRLGVPLLFGLVVIVPIGVVARHMALWMKGEPFTVVIAKVQLLYRLNDWLVIEHLWFLVVTILFSLLFAASAALMRRYGSPRALMRRFDRHITWPPAMLVGLVCLIFLGYFGILKFAEHYWHIRQAAALDIRFLWISIDHFPYFALGLGLFFLPALHAAFERISALIALVAFVGFALLLNGKTPGLIGWFAVVLTAVSATQLVLAACARWAGTANLLVRTLADRSFIIYVIHVPVYFLIALAFVPTAMPSLIKFLLVTLLTVPVCYWLAGLARRRRWTAILLGGENGPAPKAVMPKSAS